MTVFILISENVHTGEKFIEGAYTSEDKVLHLIDTLPLSILIGNIPMKK